MTKKRRIIISLSTPIIAIAPIATVVSCSVDNQESKPTLVNIKADKLYNDVNNICNNSSNNLETKIYEYINNEYPNLNVTKNNITFDTNANELHIKLNNLTQINFNTTHKNVKWDNNRNILIITGLTLSENIDINAIDLWTDINKTTITYTINNINDSKNLLLTKIQKKYPNLLAKNSISDLEFTEDGNFVSLSINVNKMAIINLDNTDHRVTYDKEQQRIYIKELNVNKEDNKITIDPNDLYDNINKIASNFGKNNLESLKQEVRSFITTNYSSLNINDLIINLNTDTNVTISIKTQQDKEIKFSDTNSNVVLGDFNKTIIIKNLSLSNQNIPQTPSSLAPNPKPENQFTSVQNNNKSEFEIYKLDASINIDGVITLAISGKDLPVTENYYANDWEIYVNDKLVKNRGWSFTSPDNNNPNYFTISQVNPTLEGQIVKIKIKDSWTNEARINYVGPVVEYQPLIKGEDYFIAPWAPSPDTTDDKYKIVNPYTKNKWILRNFGSAPLPLIPKLSEEDIYNSFYNYVLNRFTGNLSVGKRIIDSEMLCNQYSKWTIDNWYYFPYYAYVNQDLIFGVTPNDLYKTQQDVEENVYITSYNDSIWKDDFMHEGPSKNIFRERLHSLLNSYARPNMTDLDKVLAAWSFTTELLWYSGNGPTTGWVEATAACTGYSEMMAQILNLLGVEAITMGTNPNDRPGKTHQCLWIKLDINESCQNCGKEEHKKWYLSDPTFSDGAERFSGHPSSRAPSFRTDCKNLILTSIVKPGENGEYDPFNNGLHYYQNNAFEYQKAKWYTPYQKREVSFSDYNISWDYWFDYSYKKPRSKPAFFNGDWYWLEVINNKYHFIKYNINKKVRTDLTSTIPPDVYNKVFGVASSYNLEFRYGMQQYGDNFIFIDEQDESYTNKKVYIHDMKNKWSLNNLIEVSLPAEYNSKRIDNFYINPKGELVVWFENFDNSVTFSETSKYLNFNSVNYTDGDVALAKRYFDFLSGFSKIGTNNYEVTINEKINFYKNTTEISKKQIDPKQKISEMNDLYNKFIKNSIKFKQQFQNEILSGIYTLNKDAFYQYGAYIDLPKLYTSKSDLFKGENPSIRYDVYFSKTSNTKSQMDLIKSNLSTINIQPDWFEDRNPEGYYLFDIYIDSMKSETMITTDVMELKLVDDYLSLGRIPSGLNGIYKNTNYSETNIDWDTESLSIRTEPQNSNNTLPMITQLKFLSFKDNQLKTLQTFNDQKLDYFIGLPTIDNAGIYYFESTINYNNKTYKLYSKFNFILDSSFKSNFDFEKIIKGIDIILKNKY